MNALVLLAFSVGILFCLAFQGATPTARAALPGAFTSIQLNELLTNPKKDWDNDGDSGAANQWIELASTSNSGLGISHLELLSHGSNNNQPALLPATAQIGPLGFFLIFVDQISAPGGFRLFPGGSQLDLIDGDTGATIDSVGYPALGTDQSYSRDANGVWQITSTPPLARPTASPFQAPQPPLPP